MKLIRTQLDGAYIRIPRPPPPIVAFSHEYGSRTGAGAPVWDQMRDPARRWRTDEIRITRLFALDGRYRRCLVSAVHDPVENVVYYNPHSCDADLARGIVLAHLDELHASEGGAIQTLVGAG